QPQNLRLPNSIEECLDEEYVGQNDAPLSGYDIELDSGCKFDVDFLLSRSYPSVLSPFDVHNPSFGAFSGFGSSFFASQDLPRQRCAGEATISDFGASRHGLGFAGAQIPSAPTLNFDNTESFDTLPEYIPQTELPPPYPYWGFSPQENSSGLLREHRQFNRSRAHINLLTGSGSRERFGRSEPAGEFQRERRPPVADHYGSVDFRYYPRRMN
ncbi:hypothetical protein EV174_003184, partial [Coemansia sp. RSA 2320]